MKKQPRLILYFRSPPEKDRLFWGDRFIRPLLRFLIRGRRIGGVERVFVNLCHSLKRLNIPYLTNLPFDKLQSDDLLIVLGRGHYSLEGYNKSNEIIAGIGLMTHPLDWPDLFEKYPVKVYLQHSEWTQDIYKRYYGNKIQIWPVGIDTTRWSPENTVKHADVLIYDKVMWKGIESHRKLLAEIRSFLESKKLSYKVIKYGAYKPNQYLKALRESKSMIFLCEHESQGIAYQEALSVNVPVFAWDQGFWLDSNRKKWKEDIVNATSVPYFDERCGQKFKDFNEFEENFDFFFTKVEKNTFKPREYILENLTLEKSGERMLQIIEQVKTDL